jgi:divalent metal cation (Fe/Co/Zn/Cd) transporter
LYEGIQKLRHPHEIDSLGVAIGILGFAIVLEGWSLRTAVKEAHHVKPHDMGWFTFIRQTRHPELAVVLLEDVGAETGLMLALGGVLMAEATGNPRWDAVGSTSIGVLLIVIAVILIIEMKSLLIGESAERSVQDRIVEAIESQPTVERLIHMRTQHLGPEEILIGAKVQYSSALSADELVRAINTTEDSIRAANTATTIIYLEPDRFSAGHPDLAAPAIDNAIDNAIDDPETH